MIEDKHGDDYVRALVNEVNALKADLSSARRAVAEKDDAIQELLSMAEMDKQALAAERTRATLHSAGFKETARQLAEAHAALKKIVDYDACGDDCSYAMQGIALALLTTPPPASPDDGR